MNTLRLYPGKIMFFDDREIENGSYSIDSDGILKVSGDMVISDYSWNNIYDKELLKKIRDSFIKESFFLKRKYVPSGWFDYKDTEKFTYTTSNFIVKQFWEDPE